MRKLLYIDAVAVLLLLVGYVYLSGPLVLGSEKTFDAGLHNSLVYLDKAKQHWAAERQTSEKDVPTIEELDPYLGVNKARIDELMALGVRYTITPIGEGNQTDVATMTQNVRFHAGVSRFYPAGTRCGLWTGWSTPPGSICFRLVENYLGVLLFLGLLALVAGNALLFVMRKRPHPQSARNHARREGGVEPPQPSL
jgi:hypothetical protein